MFAAEHGYQYVGDVRGFPRHFIFRKIDHSGSAEARHLTFALLDDLRNELPPDHWNSHYENFLTDFLILFFLNSK